MASDITKRPSALLNRLQSFKAEFEELKVSIHLIYVNVFWKIDHLRTGTEIRLLPVHDRYTNAWLLVKPRMELIGARTNFLTTLFHFLWSLYNLPLIYRLL